MNTARFCSAMMLLLISTASVSAQEPTPKDVKAGAAGKTIARVCPLYPIQQIGDQYEHECELYLTNDCTDIPTIVYDLFDEPTFAADCSECRIFVEKAKPTSTSVPSPRRHKVGVEDLPIGLNPNLVPIMDKKVKFRLADGETVYMRVFTFLYYNRKEPTKSHVFNIGWERVEPLEGEKGIVEYEFGENGDVIQPDKDNPKLFMFVKGGRRIPMQRAASTSGKTTLQNPTPAKKQ